MAMDRDRGGSIQREEYISEMRAIQAREYPADRTYDSCGRPDLDIEGGFLATDADRDGQVSRAEFLNRCERPPDALSVGPIQEPFEDPRACPDRFAAGDLDGDGFWSIAELAAAYSPSYGMRSGLAVPLPGHVYSLACSPPYKAPPEVWLRRFDYDRDGRVSRDEACDLLTGARRSTPAPPYPSSPPLSAPDIGGEWGLASEQGTPGTTCAGSGDLWKIVAPSDLSVEGWILQVTNAAAPSTPKFWHAGNFDGKQWVFGGGGPDAVGRVKYGEREVISLTLDESGKRLTGFSLKPSQPRKALVLLRRCP